MAIGGGPTIICDGRRVGMRVGAFVGMLVGMSVGISVGMSVGAIAKLLAELAKLLAELPKLLAAGLSAVLDGLCFGGVSTHSCAQKEGSFPLSMHF